MAFSRAVVVSITGKAFSDASFNFRWHPSSDNWMVVDKAMKAHQVANFAREETISIILAEVSKEQTVDALAKHFDDTQELVEKLSRKGHIRLIKSAA